MISSKIGRPCLPDGEIMLRDMAEGWGPAA
nr:MAG TPA: hypothetical protein [Caudoviricetes sp.]